jgi:hypothetical protein
MFSSGPICGTTEALHRSDGHTLGSPVRDHAREVSNLPTSSWENHNCENHGNTQISPNLSHSYERGWPLACLDGLIKPNQASHQGARWTSSVSMLKVPVCLGSNYRNISCLTLVQKVIPGYLQMNVDNYSWACLWLISHDLSHGVPLMLFIIHWAIYCIKTANERCSQALGGTLAKELQ